MKNLGKAIILTTGLLLAGESLVPSSQMSGAEAASIIKLNNVSFQTLSNLNMRVGVGTNFKLVVQIPKGKSVTATEKVGNWYKVSYKYISNGKSLVKTGWVLGSYLKENKPATIKFTKTAYQTTANLALRTGAGTSYQTITTIPKGKNIYSSEKLGIWYKVSYSYSLKGKSVTVTGWVSSAFLKEYYSYTNTGLNIFVKKSANLYPSPDTKIKAIQNISSNNGFYSNQKITNSIGQIWYLVGLNGKNLYINSNDIYQSSFKSSASTKYKTNKDTYLYASFGTVYPKLIKIPKDSILSSGLSIDNWYKTSWNGKTGFVFSGDLNKYTVEQTQLTETAISGKTFVTLSDIALTKTADSSSDQISKIPIGKFLFPLAKVSNGYYKVIYAEKTGYVAPDYFKEVVTGDPMNRYGYQFVDLRKASNVTADQINNYINKYSIKTGKTSVLKGKGNAFIAAGKQYGVNALYLAAHAIHESQYGTSVLSLGKNNLFGFGAFDDTPFIAAYKFNSVEQCINYIAQEVKATYLNPESWKYNNPYLGFSTRTADTYTKVDLNSTGMNFYYATDPLWGKTIAKHMEGILSYNPTEYSNAPVDTRNFTSPSKPTGVDTFPPGILAVTNSDLVWEAAKGSTINSKSSSPSIIKKGTAITLLEKHTDFWVKFRVNGKDYWTRGINFNNYKDYISVKNLARTLDAVNLRPEPSLKNQAIVTLAMNQYIELLLDKSGNPITKWVGTRLWYNVKANDKRGWVHSAYLVQELK